jgi:hypothetical protein
MTMRIAPVRATRIRRPPSRQERMVGDDTLSAPRTRTVRGTAEHAREQESDREP